MMRLTDMRNKLLTALLAFLALASACFANIVKSSSGAFNMSKVHELEQWRNPYVSGGLIGMYDAIWNAGPLKHDNYSQIWTDLSGNRQHAHIVKSSDFTKECVFEDNACRMDGTFCFAFTPSKALKDACLSDMTIEVCC